MAIKVDLEKANDRLQWGFILETLNLAGIPNYLTELIIYEMCRNCFSQCVMEWAGGHPKLFFPEEESDKVTRYPRSTYLSCAQKDYLS